MLRQNLNLKWESHTDHYKELMENLLTSEESSDVTIVCDGHVKFNAHKFVLKACSPVFESMLEEIHEKKTIVYLRGVNQLDMSKMLKFMYSGEATIHQERIKEFINIGKDLQIKEIGDMSGEDSFIKLEKDVNESNKETVSQDFVNTENEFDETEDEETNTFLDDEGESFSYFEMENEGKESNQAELQEEDSTVTDDIENKTQFHATISGKATSGQWLCPQCEAEFTCKKAMKRHIRYKHGKKYACNKCDHLASAEYNLRAHIKSVHNGVKYSCNQCDYKAKWQQAVTKHINSIHKNNKKLPKK